MSKEKKEEGKKASEEVLKTADSLLHGFRSFFKKAEQSKTFGSRLKRIREEMDKRFGKK